MIVNVSQFLDRCCLSMRFYESSKSLKPGFVWLGGKACQKLATLQKVDESSAFLATRIKALLFVTLQVAKMGCYT